MDQRKIMYSTIQVYGVFHPECAMEIMNNEPHAIASLHVYNQSVRPEDECWLCKQKLSEE